MDMTLAGWSNILLVSDYTDNDNRVEIDYPGFTGVVDERKRERRKEVKQEERR